MDPLDDPKPHSPGRLHDRVAIVTGSSSGFGRAIAFRFSREGAKLLCADITPETTKAGSRDADRAYTTHEYIVAKGGTAEFVKTDVGHESSVQALVARAVELHGRLDIFINNAGICPESAPDQISELIHEQEVKVWDTTMRVNARGSYLGCKYACEQFMKQNLLPSGDRGWIVNIGSTASLTASQVAAYDTSKGAVLQLTKTVAVSMAPYKIHCNIVCPGDATTACYDPHVNDREAINKSISLYPWGRFGKLTEIAGAVLFLASDDAGYVTGAVLSVDGGFVSQ